MSEIKQVWGIIKDYKCADLKMVQDPALAVFQHQQAKIEKLENELSTTKQVLGNVIDMEVAKVDNLKAQLNNMEACYIEKKKRVDELEGALNEVKEWKSHPVGYEASFGSWGVRDFYRGLAEKALRGGHE